MIDYSNNADLNNILNLREENMGWGTIVNTEFTLSRLKKDELKDRLEELYDQTFRLKQELLVLCASDNAVFDKERYESKNDFILIKFNEIMDMLEDAMIERERIEIALNEDSTLEEY